MKRIFVSIILLLNIEYGSAQAFQGKITYKNSFRSKSPGVHDKRLDSMFGNTQDYYIRGGDYKTISNGSFLQAQLYINKENKLYSKTSNTDMFQSLDVAINPDEILKTELKKEVTEVLGYLCDELVLTCKSGVQKYYFNPKLTVNPELFKAHQYGNWNAYLKLSNALPLKMIVENQQFTMEMVSTELLPMVLEEQSFQLASNLKTFKIPVNSQNWVLLKTKFFRIYFPYKPTEEVQTVKTELGHLSVYNYNYEVPSFDPDSNIMYSVAESDYPDNLIHSDNIEILDKFFEGSINGVVNNVQGRLLVTSNILLDGFPGREIKIDFHNGLAVIKIRMFLIKNKMIMLQTMTYLKNDPNNSMDRFMNSFCLNK